MAINKIRGDDYTPGDLGFDPLNISRSVGSAEKQRELELKELNNGRLAMLAITGYAVQECTTLGTVLHDWGSKVSRRPGDWCWGWGVWRKEEGAGGVLVPFLRIAQRLAP